MTTKRDAVRDVVENELEHLLDASKRMSTTMNIQRESLKMTQADFDSTQARIAELEGFLASRKEVAA